jgi:hypothetical protein
MRVLLVVIVAACSATDAAPVAKVKGGPLPVEAADRACKADADCTAILTMCSMCEGACTGVRTDKASRYDGKLDCTDYHGHMCNYDCRPEFKIEEPRCVSSRCESVKKNR